MRFRRIGARTLEVAPARYSGKLQVMPFDIVPLVREMYRQMAHVTVQMPDARASAVCGQ